MRSLVYRPKDHFDLLSEEVKAPAKPLTLPVIVDRKNVQAPTMKPVTNIPQEPIPDPIKEPSFVLPQNLPIKSDHSLDQIYLAQIQSLQQRLSESEKSQRSFMIEMNRLQGNMNETFRHQESALRDESQIVRSQDDHLRFLKDLIRNLQDQLQGILHQQDMHKESLSKLSDFTRQKSSQDDRFSRDVFDRLDDQRKTGMIQASEISSLRQEMQQIRLNIDHRFETVVAKMGDDLQSLKATVGSLKSDVDNLHAYLVRLDVRLSGSAKTADNNLLKVGKVLLDHSISTKELEDQQHAQLKKEFEARLEESNRWIKAEEDLLRKEIREKYDSLSNHVDSEKKSLESWMSNAMETRVADLDSWTRKKIQELNQAKGIENTELLKTVQALKNTILSKRTKDQDTLIEFSRLLEETRDDLLQEIHTLKRDLEASHANNKQQNTSYIIY